MARPPAHTANKVQTIPTTSQDESYYGWNTTNTRGKWSIEKIMTIKEFNDKYKELGGVKLLNQFRAELKSAEFIGNHFGVGKESVQQWFEEFFGERYDPRATRKQRRLELMLESAPKMTRTNWEDAFHYESNTDEALALIALRGINFKDQQV